MSYEGMAISEGQAAGRAFLERMEEEPTRQAEITEALLDYCRQHTLAMVELRRGLAKMAGGRVVPLWPHLEFVQSRVNQPPDLARKSGLTGGS